MTEKNDIIFQPAPAVCFAAGEYPPTIGGLAKSAKRIVGYLSDAGYKVHVVVPVPGTPVNKLPSPRMEGIVKIYRIPVGDERSIRNGTYLNHALYQLDKIVGFDLFHGFFLPMAYSCILVRGRRKLPIIASIRGSDAAYWNDTPESALVTRTVLKMASWVTSVNTEYIREMKSVEDISGRSSVIFSGIDCSSYPEWDITMARRGVVGAVGKFQPCKEIPLLVEAFAGIAPQWRRELLLVGDFQEEAERLRCWQSLEKTGLEAAIHLTGMVTHREVKKYLTEMRVFVQCSSKEGLPNTLLEAAAAGVPIVATSVGGMLDILEHNVNALLVPPGDSVELSRAIESVLRDDDLSRHLSRGARRLAANLDVELEKTQWLGLYEQLLCPASWLRDRKKSPPVDLISRRNV
jgi:glycosyltransferase involved in cell wall biosynthesis